MGNSRGISSLRRISVAEQVAAAMRENIEHRAWTDILPAEQDLARRWKVGRHSVRAAVARLAAEGLLAVRKGQRSRIRPDAPRCLRRAPPGVCVVVSTTRESLDWLGHHVLLEIHAALAELGIDWEEVFDVRLAGRNPEPHLRRLATARKNTCWLLVQASPAVQRWFEHARVPAVVVGGCQDGVCLPSVNTDYHATGWHAAGWFATLRHRHVVIVLPDPPMPGGLACHAGFIAYLAKQGNPMTVSEIRLRPGQTIAAKLDPLLARTPRPTGVFSALARDALGVLFHLQDRRLHVPADLSLVSTDTHVLEQGIPGICRYHISARQLAHRVVRLVRSLLAGHAVPPKANLLMPTFVRGATLTRPPPAA